MGFDITFSYKPSSYWVLISLSAINHPAIGVRPFSGNLHLWKRQLPQSPSRKLTILGNIVGHIFLTLYVALFENAGFKPPSYWYDVVKIRIMNENAA